MRKLQPALFFLLIALCLVPVWWFRYFPSQDGPSHVYNSAILANWNGPASEIFRQYYSINTRPEPNWLSHAIVAGLIKLGARPLVAEKIFISLFIVLLAMGMWTALGGVSREARPLAVLVLPLALGWPIGMGFFNYCLGLAGFLWVFAWWHPRRDGMRPARIAMLGAMGIGLYFTHLVAIGGLMTAAVTVALWESLAQRPFSAGFKKRVLPLIIGFIPAIALALAFVAGSAAQGRMSGTPLFTIGFWKLAPLITLQNILVCYSVWEYLPAIALSVALLGSTAVILHSEGRRRENEGLLIAAAVFVLLYFVAPHELAGGTYLFRRLVPLALFMLILWLGAQWQRAYVTRWLYVAGIVIALVFAGMRTAQFARLNGYIEEFVSVGGVIKEPATVLPLCLAPRGTDENGRVLSLEIWPFSHASGYMAAGRSIVDLSDYEGAMGYFPLLWRPEVNPFEHMGVEIFDDPFHLNFLSYEEKTRGRGRIDYVLVWSDPLHPAPPALTAPIERQLAAGWRLVVTSKPRGYARLYAKAQ